MNGTNKRIKRYGAIACIMVYLLILLVPDNIWAAIADTFKKDTTQTRRYTINTNLNLLTPKNSTFSSSYYSFRDGIKTYMDFETGSLYNHIESRNVTTQSGTAFVGTRNNIGAYNGGYSLRGNNTGLYLYTDQLGINPTTDSAITVSLAFQWDGTNAGIPVSIAGVTILIMTNEIGFNTGNGDIYGFTNPLRIGEWNVLTVSMKKGDFYSGKFYINGNLQTMNINRGYHDSTRILGTAGCDILGDPYSNWTNNSGNSNLDDLVIWNRQLSDSEVTNFYDFIGWTSGYRDDTFVGPNMTRGTEDGENYLRLFGSASSSEISQFIQTSGVAANTQYTISADVRVNSASTTKPTLYAKSLVNGVTLASDASTTQGTWERLVITASSESNAALNIFFSKGNATSIDIRRVKIEKGSSYTPDISYATTVTGKFTDFPELSSKYGISNYISYSESGYSATNLSATNVVITPVPTSITTRSYSTTTTSQTFSSQVSKSNITNSSSNFASSVYINSNGFTGNIPLTNIDWKANWVTGRTVNLTNSFTDNIYYKNISDFKYPNSMSASYYDSVTNTTINASIPPTNTPQAIDTKTTTLTSESWGYNGFYDVDKISLQEEFGYMSNNTSTYWGGAYNFNDPRPRKPSDYYGPDDDKSGWQLVDWQWISNENYVGDANNYSNAPYFGYPYNRRMWITDGSRLGYVTKNKYRKGVYLKYTKNVSQSKYSVNYGGTAKLPDYISSYNGTAYYSGTLIKNTGSGTYNAATQWYVDVTYDGTMTAINNNPIANFAVTPSPALHNELLKYTDSSYDPDPWDRIVTKQWSYSSNGGTTYSAASSTAPTSLPNLNNQASTTYKIKLVVTDTLGLTGQVIKDLVVYPKNTKPIAVFKVEPTLVRVNDTLTFTDLSSAMDTWDSISTHYWYYKKSTDSTWTTGKPTKFTSLGTWEVKHQVKDTGNVRSAALLSDEYIETINVNPDDGSGKPAIPNIKLKSLEIVGSSDELARTNIYKNITYRVKAIIENNTVANIITPFNTSFNINSIGINGNMAVSSLSAGETKTLYYSFTVPAIGADISDTLEVYADSNDVIFESDENDNARALSIKIISITLNITGVVSPNPAYAGERIQITCNTVGFGEKVIVKMWNGATVELTPKQSITQDSNVWTGRYIVPLNTKKGDYIMLATVTRGSNSASTNIKLTIKGNIYNLVKPRIVDSN